MPCSDCCIAAPPGTGTGTNVCQACLCSAHPELDIAPIPHAANERLYGAYGDARDLGPRNLREKPPSQMKQVPVGHVWRVLL